MPRMKGIVGVGAALSALLAPAGELSANRPGSHARPAGPSHARGGGSGGSIHRGGASGPTRNRSFSRGGGGVGIIGVVPVVAVTVAENPGTSPLPAGTSADAMPVDALSAVGPPVSTTPTGPTCDALKSAASVAINAFQASYGADTYKGAFNAITTAEQSCAKVLNSYWWPLSDILFRLAASGSAFHVPESPRSTPVLAAAMSTCPTVFSALRLTNAELQNDLTLSAAQGSLSPPEATRANLVGSTLQSNLSVCASSDAAAAYFKQNLGVFLSNDLVQTRANVQWFVTSFSSFSIPMADVALPSGITPPTMP